jgi:TRAP-type C4-dicarboxylate transport system substrate-binding protein
MRRGFATPDRGKSGGTFVFRGSRLRLATHWPVLHDMNNGMIEYAREIGRESEGRIEVSYYPAGTLAGSGEKLQKLCSGVCDIANIHLATTIRASFPWRN